MEMMNIGSADPPTPPDVGPTIEELAEIAQDIKSENTVPSWEWTEYIYGTILPYIDDLHEAGALYEVTLEDEDGDCPYDGYTFSGFRNKLSDKKEGWGCCTKDTTVNTNLESRGCWTFVDG